MRSRRWSICCRVGSQSGVGMDEQRRREDRSACDGGTARHAPPDSRQAAARVRTPGPLPWAENPPSSSRRWPRGPTMAPRFDGDGLAQLQPADHENATSARSRLGQARRPRGSSLAAERSSCSTMGGSCVVADQALIDQKGAEAPPKHTVRSTTGWSTGLGPTLRTHVRAHGGRGKAVGAGRRARRCRAGVAAPRRARCGCHLGDGVVEKIGIDEGRHIRSRTHGG